MYLWLCILYCSSVKILKKRYFINWSLLSFKFQVFIAFPSLVTLYSTVGYLKRGWRFISNIICQNCASFISCIFSLLNFIYTCKSKYACGWIRILVQVTPCLSIWLQIFSNKSAKAYTTRPQEKHGVHECNHCNVTMKILLQSRNLVLFIS